MKKPSQNLFSKCQQKLVSRYSKLQSSYIKVIHSQCRKLDNRDAFCMFHVTISILQCKQVLVCSHVQVQQERHNSAYRDHKQESGATTLHKLLVICTFGAFHNRDWTWFPVVPKTSFHRSVLLYQTLSFQSALEPTTHGSSRHQRNSERSVQ